MSEKVPTVSQPYEAPSIPQPQFEESNSPALFSSNEVDIEASPSKHTQRHQQRNKQRGRIVRDFTIGFSDGLTVPFALTAGLSSLGSSHIVILAGLAELFAGSISMGLGAWLAVTTEAQQYESEEAQERFRVAEKLTGDGEEIFEILQDYGISRRSILSFVNDLRQDKKMWLRFIMDFKLRLEKPAMGQAWISAVSMGSAYFAGGILPMIPYFAMSNATHALFVSVGITIVVLITFGYAKSYATVSSMRGCVYGSVQTLAVGIIAAGVSYGVVRGFNQIPGLHARG